MHPFNKFLTIKGIVFLTFWQGLLISIVIALLDRDNDNSSFGIAASSTATSSGADENGAFRFLQAAVGSTAVDDKDTMSSMEKAAQIQNFLICLEMLFFSIAHWCVFPAEEWEPNYMPVEYERPGLGLKDFASDVGQIMKGRSEARRAARARSASNDDDKDDEEHGDSNDVEECLDGDGGGLDGDHSPYHDAEHPLHEDDNRNSTLIGLDEPLPEGPTTLIYPENEIQ